MLFALGAASTAVDALSLLKEMTQSSKSKTGVTQSGSNGFTIKSSDTASAGTSTSGASGATALSSGTLSTLIAAQSQSSTSTSTTASSSDTSDRFTSALKSLFSKLDADGDGKVSKTEFEDALGQDGKNVKAADSVFAKMDKDGDGNISVDELSSVLKAMGGKHKGHAKGAGTDPLLEALNGASSTSSTAADGSTTTTLSYADGSKVTMTQPSSASKAGGTASSSYNYIEQLIQKQAQTIAASATSSVSLNV